MKRYVYSEHKIILQQDEVYRNPRLFIKPEPDASFVVVIGNLPNIAAAYRRAGIPVQLGAAVPIIPPTFLCGSDDERVEIPSDYQELPWSELHALAVKCGNKYAINREQAINAIENYHRVTLPA